MRMENNIFLFKQIKGLKMGEVNRSIIIEPVCSEIEKEDVKSCFLASQVDSRRNANK